MGRQALGVAMAAACSASAGRPAGDTRCQVRIRRNVPAQTPPVKRAAPPVGRMWLVPEP